MKSTMPVAKPASTSAGACRRTGNDSRRHVEWSGGGRGEGRHTSTSKPLHAGLRRTHCPRRPGSSRLHQRGRSSRRDLARRKCPRRPRRTRPAAPRARRERPSPGRWAGAGGHALLLHKRARAEHDAAESRAAFLGAVGFAGQNGEWRGWRRAGWPPDGGMGRPEAGKGGCVRAGAGDVGRESCGDGGRIQGAGSGGAGARAAADAEAGDVAIFGVGMGMGTVGEGPERESV